MIRTTRLVAFGLALAIVVAGHGIKRKLDEVAAQADEAAWSALWRDAPRDVVRARFAP